MLFHGFQQLGKPRQHFHPDLSSSPFSLKAQAIECLVICMLAIFVGGSVNTGAADLSAHPAPAAREAQRLSSALQVAETDQQAETLIREILQRLAVPVLESADTAASQGQGLYSVELRMIAQAFRSGTLTPLDNLVGMWQEAGLLCGTGECTGIMVEKALRTLRAQAENDTDNPEWFLIYMMDALGNRKNAPFTLLGPCDDECLSETETNAQGVTINNSPNLAEARQGNAMGPIAGNPLMSGSLEDIFDDEDADMAAFMKKMQASGQMQDMLSKIGKTGAPPDPSWAIDMAAAMGQIDNPEEIKLKLQQARSAAANLPPQVRQQIETATGALQQPVPTGGSQAQTAASRSKALLQQQREAAKRNWEMARDGAEKKYQEEMSYVTEDDDALALYRINENYLSGLSNADLLIKPEYQEKLWVFDRMEDAQYDVKEEPDDSKTVGLAFIEPPKTTCLQLDPIQVMLISLDLVGMRQGGNSHE